MNIQDIAARFEWDNPSTAKLEGDKLLLTAKAGTDYFVDPASGEATLNAPYYHMTVSGDFTLRAKASRSFVSTFDACALLAMGDDGHWAKLCFELTDLGPKAIVTVVTREFSDDANGVWVDSDTVWLQLARKGSLFAMHYSLDGVTYKMARLLHLNCKESLKLGFVAQSPTGSGGVCCYEEIDFQAGAPQDMRKGS